VHKLISTFGICQQTKITLRKYGHSPKKRHILQVLVKTILLAMGPYRCVSLIDPASNCFETQQAQNREEHNMTRVMVKTWLTQYQWPTILVFDKGTEFIGEFDQMIAKDYGIEWK
jgi:hypothetical protein